MFWFLLMFSQNSHKLSQPVIKKATTVARVLVRDWFVRFGVPKRIHSDQGRNFESKLIQELCKVYGITKSHTTPYHPEGNGQCERFNRTLHDRLRTLPPDQKRKWPEHIPELVYAYNCTPHSSTGYSPHYLFFGREPVLPVDHLLGLAASPSAGSPQVEEWIAEHHSRLDDAFQRAFPNDGEGGTTKERLERLEGYRCRSTHWGSRFHQKQRYQGAQQDPRCMGSRTSHGSSTIGHRRPYICCAATNWRAAV